MSEIKKGIYRHYKGGEYKVLYLVKNSENKEDMVVYQDVKDESKIWVRPKKMFLETVEIKDEKEKEGEEEKKPEKKARFEFIKEEDLDSWENKYLRALADYQNLLKQSAKDRSDFVKYALSEFLHSIVPVYDHLKLSIQGLSEADSQNPWAQGVSHVLKQFKEVLNNHGVEEIKTVGEKFDHETMEAVDGSGEKVKQEIMPGYKLNGKLVRPAKVIVE